MKIQKLVIHSLLALSTLSCGAFKTGAGITKTSSESFAATNPNDIEVYFSSKPDKAFTEIGSVSVLRVKSLIWPAERKAEEIQKEMKELASTIGGNAIIDYRESGEANMTGTVIRYKE